MFICVDVCGGYIWWLTYFYYAPWKYLSPLKLGNNFARKHGLSYSSFSSFFRWASEYPLFSISWTLVHFSHLSFFLFVFFLFVNNFCIATCFFSAIKLLRDSNKNLEHLFGGYPIGHIFLVFTPSVGVKHFWVDLDGMACFCAYP